MKNESDAKRDASSEQGSSLRTMNRAGRHDHEPASARPGAAHFSAADLLPFATALGRRWEWLLIGGVEMALVGLLCGVLLWKNSYTASAQLLRQTSARVTEVIGDRELEPGTSTSLLRSPELLERVTAQATLPLVPGSLAKRLNITSERNSEVLLVAISTTDPQSAVALVNLYAQEAVRFTQGLQGQAAARAGFFLTQQLAPLEAEIAELNQTPDPSPLRPVTAVQSAFVDKLQTARLELTDLLAIYTEQNPVVQHQRVKIATIETELRQISATTNLAAESGDDTRSKSILPNRDPAYIHTKFQSLENARLTLLGLKRAALSLELNPPGSCRILALATLGEVIPHRRTAKLVALAGLAGILGLLMASAWILFREALDPRLKTATDVERVTGLPVLASADDLSRMTQAEQTSWAFRAWTSLQGSLSPAPNQGFVCGITSSESGEGRSTWIRLLADAASQCGFRVLTIVVRPSEENAATLAATSAVAGATANAEATLSASGPGKMVASDILNAPDEVTQQLIGPNSVPVVQIPLPGWVWNLERRKQWRAALGHWSKIDNIALLVELPPASLSETVLLAENLPNLIWLADVEKATATRTREQLATLRHARCRLAGVVLNRAPVPFLKNRFARWFGCAVLMLGLHNLPAHAFVLKDGPLTGARQCPLLAGLSMTGDSRFPSRLPFTPPPP